MKKMLHSMLCFCLVFITVGCSNEQPVSEEQQKAIEKKVDEEERVHQKIQRAEFKKQGHSQSVDEGERAHQAKQQKR